MRCCDAAELPPAAGRKSIPLHQNIGNMMKRTFHLFSRSDGRLGGGENTRHFGVTCFMQLTAPPEKGWRWLTRRPRPIKAWIPIRDHNQSIVKPSRKEEKKNLNQLSAAFAW